VVGDQPTGALGRRALMNGYPRPRQWDGSVEDDEFTLRFELVRPRYVRGVDVAGILVSPGRGLVLLLV